MWLYRNKIALVLLGLLMLILIVVIPLIAFLILAEQQQHVPGRLTPTPRASQTPGGALVWLVISRNVPIFASSSNYPASHANTGNYDTSWRSKGALPGWRMNSLASRLSSVARYSLYGITGHITMTMSSLRMMLTNMRRKAPPSGLGMDSRAPAGAQPAWKAGLMRSNKR
jgi:hypothetical protein